MICPNDTYARIMDSDETTRALAGDLAEAMQILDDALALLNDASEDVNAPDEEDRLRLESQRDELVRRVSRRRGLSA